MDLLEVLYKTRALLTTLEELDTKSIELRQHLRDTLIGTHIKIRIEPNAVYAQSYWWLGAYLDTWKFHSDQSKIIRVAMGAEVTQMMNRIRKAN